MNRRTRSFAFASMFLILGTALAAAPADPSPLDAALGLVPKDAVAFVIVPSPKLASDELQQCFERMDRPELAVAGRPIDQLKAFLQISASFDDKGSAAIALLRRGERDVPVAFIPVMDGDAFLKGNFVPVPDAGEGAWKRSGSDAIVFARVVGRHVLMSTDADVARTVSSAGGIGAALRERLGQRGSALLGKGDVIAWASGTTLRDASQRALNAAPQIPLPSQAESARAALKTFAEETSDALLVVDFDPLGVGVRTFARATPNSSLSDLMKGGKGGGGSLDRLPREPFYFIACVDLEGLGGASAFAALAKAVGAGELPAWFAPIRDHARRVQFAIYPSKLGIAAGGLLNDALLVVESPKPELVRDGIKQAFLATAGEARGMKREPSWTADKELKGGAVADAFELKETVITNGPQATDAGMSRLFTQIVFGSRGFVGFVKQVSGAVLMTFSQRVDVLERAVQASGGGKSYGNDATIKSFKPWLIEGADVEAFVGVAQLGKLAQQVAAMFPGGDQAPVPEIAANVDPIAFALDIDEGTASTAAVFPSSVLATFYDLMKRELGGPPAAQPGAPPAKPGATP